LEDVDKGGFDVGTIGREEFFGGVVVEVTQVSVVYADNVSGVLGFKGGHKRPVIDPGAVDGALEL